MALPPGVRPDRFESPDRRADVAAELAFHLEARIRELEAAGVPPADARAQAEAEFGPVAPVAADCNRIQQTRSGRRSRIAALRGSVLDLKATLRSLARTPGYTMLAVATFALGVGAATAVFGVLDGVLFKPLPYAALDRLVRIYDQNDRRQTGQLTIADITAYHQRAQRFDGFAAFRWRSAVLTGHGSGAVHLAGAEVWASFFDVLGVSPAMGRGFARGEDLDGPGDVVVLSFNAWRDHFGSDPAVVGRTIGVNGTRVVVIGVLDRGFINPLGSPVDVWFANDFGAVARDLPRASRMHFLAGIGRLAEGVSLEQGRGELAAISSDLAQADPESNRGHAAFILPLQDAGVSAFRPTLMLVLVAVMCLMLITCANIANLVLARALQRGREFALRTALGAGRWAIVRQVTAEQLVLAVAGGAVGLGVAWAVITAGRLGLAGMVPRVDRIVLDGRAFAVAMVLALVTALLSGVLPAWVATRRERGGGLGDRGGLSRRAVFVRSVLLTVQTGLAAVLLMAAGLTARSLLRLSATDLGFVPENVWTFSLALPEARYPDREAVSTTTTELLESFRAIPGVRSVSASYALPMENRSTTSIRIEGQPATDAPAPEAGYNAAAVDYFSTLGIPLREGRTFDARDQSGSDRVVLVNESLARRFFPGESPVGRRIRTGPDPASPPQTIIGVVGDIRRDSRAAPPEPELYFPLTQDVTSRPSFAVQVESGAPAVLAAVRDIVSRRDAELPLLSVQPLARIVAATIAQSRIIALVLVGFGVLAMLVAAVGVYGVMALLVTERQRDIAVRLAVGATARQVVREATLRGTVPAGVGLLVGVLAAVGAGTTLRAFLFEVGPGDPLVLAGVVAAMGATALAGSWIPARRASRVPPAAVLRE